MWELVEGVEAGHADALALLGDIGDPDAFDALVELTASGEPRLRASAASSLGYVGDVGALAVLVTMVEDADEMVVRAAVGALADLGDKAAVPALSPMLARPALADETRRALAWLGAHPDFDAVMAKLADKRIWSWELARSEWVRHLGQMGGRRALDALVELMERVKAHEPWQGVDIVYAVAALDLPERDDVLARWAEGEGPTGQIARVVLGEPPRHAADFDPEDATLEDRDLRTVQRWALHPEAVEEPITGLVTKFGGQPVWRDTPCWPLAASSGQPMVFYAQFLLPREVAGDGTWMAYLFLRPDGESYRPEGGDNALVVQPGPDPPLVETVARTSGPTYMTAHWDHSRFRPRCRRLLLEYTVELEPGADPETWTDKVLPDAHGDWNKVGGTPLWLQSPEWPAGDYRFAFQFTPSAVGTEFGDGAEAYGFVTPDGHGRFLWQCH